MLNETDLLKLHDAPRGKSDIVDLFVFPWGIYWVDDYKFGYPLVKIERGNYVEEDFVFLLSLSHPRVSEVLEKSCWRCKVVAHPEWDTFFYLHPMEEIMRLN